MNKQILELLVMLFSVFAENEEEVTSETLSDLLDEMILVSKEHSLPSLVKVNF